MICYLVRHGKDDETIRGGWSDHGLTAPGRDQVLALAQKIAADGPCIDRIVSSDLQRAKETADILAHHLNLPVMYHSGFRETNNGTLAGMEHELAEERFPGVYWSSLGYREHFPGGESPEEFFLRVQSAWSELKTALAERPEETVLLVTHGGVIETILCIEHGIPPTNKRRYFSIPNAELIPIKVDILG